MKMLGLGALARSSLVVAFTACALTTSATAQTRLTGPSAGHTYFNRAGATIEEHDEAIRGCQRLVRNLSFNRTSTPTAGSSDGAALAAIIGDASANVRASRRTYAAGIENCMVVRGWRVVRMERTLGAALDDLSAAGIRAELVNLVGAETPGGQIVRTFNNDMQTRDTVWSGAPRDLDVVSFSLQANTAERSVRQNDDEARLPSRPRSSADPRVRRPRDAGRLAAEETVIVLQTTGGGAPLPTKLRLERIGQDPNRPAWLDDGLPSGFDVEITFPRRTFVIAVPPGRWRVNSLERTDPYSGAIYTTTFCLGAPSFEVAAGEAVYAGSFDIDDAAFGPDMDLVPVQATLTDAPLISSRLRAASYVNGATYECDGTYIYAVEAPGAPFAEGYNAGSNYRATATTPAVEEAAPETTPTL